MADLDFKELQGNGLLLEAARLLLLMSQSKDKPHKVTRGSCEYAARVARYCFARHQELEGASPGGKAAAWESLFDSTLRLDPDPVPSNSVASANSLEKSREVFNSWHSQLAIAVDATAYLFNQVEDGGVSSVAGILLSRFENLLEVCPWPGGGTAGGGSSAFQ